jgi:hypothetical protein
VRQIPTIVLCPTPNWIWWQTYNVDNYLGPNASRGVPKDSRFQSVWDQSTHCLLSFGRSPAEQEKCEIAGQDKSLSIRLMERKPTHIISKIRVLLDFRFRSVLDQSSDCSLSFGKNPAAEEKCETVVQDEESLSSG